MKKNIEYFSLSPTLARYLSDRLKESGVEGAGELASKIYDLENKKNSALIIEMNEGGAVGTFSDSICIDELEIIPRYRRVIVSGKEALLTPKEYDILYFLVSNRGEIFTKEQIYKAVWEDEYLMDDSNIMSFIRKLRKKIEPNPDAPKYILTVWGIGYKFNDR